jgi:hypothetical protein
VPCRPASIARSCSLAQSGPLSERTWLITRPETAPMDSYILMMVFRVWLLEIVVTGFNYFVLMKQIYEPRYGVLKAHRIGMTTRIVYIFIFACFLDYFAELTTVGDYMLAGSYWVVMILAFEWIGSFLLRRPVHEILEGWHIERGFMWPYVLVTYLMSPLIVGLVLDAAAR